MEILVKCGLQNRFPVECDTWVKRRQEARRNLEAEIKEKEAAFKDKLADKSAQLEEVLREAIVDRMVTMFPCVAVLVSTITDRLM
jgi:hypothetical protein